MTEKNTNTPNTQWQPNPEPVSIALNELTVDPALQVRAELNEAAIEEYADAIRAGAQLPPIVALIDGDTTYLLDGTHRSAAIRRANPDVPDSELHIEALVGPGTREDAVLFVVQANANHGLRRSSADKRRAVQLLLGDPEWSNRSDRWIAERCKVSHPLVARVRSESTGNVSRWRFRQDGKMQRSGAREKAPARLLGALEADDRLRHYQLYWDLFATEVLLAESVGEAPEDTAAYTGMNLASVLAVRSPELNTRQERVAISEDLGQDAADECDQIARATVQSLLEGRTLVAKFFAQRNDFPADAVRWLEETHAYHREENQRLKLEWADSVVQELADFLAIEVVGAQLARRALRIPSANPEDVPPGAELWETNRRIARQALAEANDGAELVGGGS